MVRGGSRRQKKNLDDVERRSIKVDSSRSTQTYTRGRKSRRDISAATLGRAASEVSEIEHGQGRMCRDHEEECRGVQTWGGRESYYIEPTRGELGGNPMTGMDKESSKPSASKLLFHHT